MRGCEADTTQRLLDETTFGRAMNDVEQQPLIPGLRAPLTPQQVFAILRGRWRWLVGTAIGFVFMGLAVALLMPQRYEATVSLLIDLPAEDQATGRAFHPALAQSYLATRMDLLRSERVRLRAIRILGMDEDLALRETFREQVSNDASFVRWLAHGMEDNITVSRASESDLIRLTYIHESPHEAARLANALAQAYMEEEIELVSGPVQARRNRFESHVDQMREAMRAAEQRLTDAQRNLQVVDPENPAGHYNNRLEDLGSRLNQLRVERQRIESRIAQLTGMERDGRPITDLLEVMETRFMEGLRDRLTTIDATRGELSDTLGPAHPRMAALAAERAAIEAELRGEVRERLSAYRRELTSLRARESALRNTLEEDRSEAINEQHLVADISPRRRDAESARRMYEMALERYSDVLRDSAEPQSTVRIVGEAAPPQHAAGPGKTLVALVGAVVGLFAGLMVAFLVELSDRRIRTEDDLERELGLKAMGRLEGRSG